MGPTAVQQPMVSSDSNRRVEAHQLTPLLITPQRRWPRQPINSIISSGTGWHHQWYPQQHHPQQSGQPTPTAATTTAAKGRAEPRQAGQQQPNGAGKRSSKAGRPHSSTPIPSQQAGSQQQKTLVPNPGAQCRIPQTAGQQSARQRVIHPSSTHITHTNPPYQADIVRNEWWLLDGAR